jgi:uncharacterized protein
MKRVSTLLILLLVITGLLGGQEVSGVNWATVTPAELDRLLANSLDIGARTENGATPLMMAAYYNPFPEVVRILLEHGAAIEARDRYGTTPLINAAMNSNQEMVRILLEHGAAINARVGEWGWTALMMAAGNNDNPEVIRILLEHGAAIEARDCDDRTPLIFAAWSNTNPEVVRVLLDAGANVRAENRYGRSAWDLMQDNDDLKGTDVYWRINDLRFE